MKIASILGHLGYQVSIRGDIDFCPGMELSKLSIDIAYHDPETPPSDEAFIKAAQELQDIVQRNENTFNKHQEYPCYEHRLSAIEKQLLALCQKSLIPLEPDFMKSLSDIEKIDAKYSAQS